MILAVERMASVIFLFSACGLAINGYLFYRLLKSWNALKTLNKVISFQLFLNICNILTHAATGISKERVWFVLSTILSFQTVYFFAAMEACSALGRPALRALNSPLNIAFLTFICTSLSTVFSHAYEICGTKNCFYNNSTQEFNPEDEFALMKSYVVHFFAPTSVILFCSFYRGFRKWEHVKPMSPSPRLASRLYQLCKSCAVALFLMYGTVVVEIMLYSTEVQSGKHLCRVSCLNEELYLLLSMFPVGFLLNFVKQNEAGAQEEEEQH